ncbi:hypothetical protein [Fictibacillus gelatini]|uniref:hypothetical protein n=1 Tax=Fictibacillus gelatini TaxID=225985 RepID=UPI00041CD266|nr:hypothetical protein [Fictibacillus gelatini]
MPKEIIEKMSELFGSLASKIFALVAIPVMAYGICFLILNMLKVPKTIANIISTIILLGSFYFSYKQIFIESAH